jgi:hypothetical protein
MSAVTLVKADPFGDKNNDKFQSYAVTAKFSMMSALLKHFNGSLHRLKQNTVTEYDENPSIRYNHGTHTSKLGTDFAYTGHAKYVFFKSLLPTDYTIK